MVTDLKGRAILVTGASTGIGAAAARAFGENGARVAVHYNTSRAEAEDVVAAIRRAGGEAVAIQGDVTASAACADIVEQTIRAFQVSATSATGYSTRGVPSGQYIAPANSNGCIEFYAGQCGGTRLMLYGPSFTRFDLSAVKKFKFTEKVNMELRGEFLNAFNNINFLVGNASNDTNAPGVGGLTWGQVTEAYRDTSTTNDPGGRLVQLVLRLNF